MLLVYGKGKTGKSVYNFCIKHGIDVVNVDDEDFNSEILNKVSKIVVSPGIAFYHRIYTEARRRNIPIISDIEFAYQFYKGKIIAITGTDGKTTTSSLIYEILKSAGLDCYIGGNYGIPFIDIVDHSEDNTICVLELSSFQLYSTQKFKPNIALILNIDTDHLDWHKKRIHYVLSKLKITKNQTKKDYLIIKENLKNCIKTQAKVIPIDINSYIDKNNEDILKIDDFSLNHKDIKLKGVHNLENIIFAIKTAKILNIENNIIINAIKNFQPLEHRLEFVKKIKEVEFYNDSKSTTVQATKMALHSFNTDVVLILGGVDKGGDFSQLTSILKNKAKAVILIGKDKYKISKQLGFEKIYSAETLEEAVKLAYNLALPNGTVLFSPGCASFDMFKNYQDRGNKFKAIVENLNEEI